MSCIYQLKRTLWNQLSNILLILRFFVVLNQSKSNIIMWKFNQNTDLSRSSNSYYSWHHFTAYLPFVPHAPCAKCCFSDSNRYNLDIECNQGKYCFLLLLTEIILRKYVRILKIQMIRKLILNRIPILRDLFPSKSINALPLP